MRTISDAVELRRAGRYLDALVRVDHAASSDLDQLSTRIMKADLLKWSAILASNDYRRARA